MTRCWSVYHNVIAYHGFSFDSWFFTESKNNITEFNNQLLYLPGYPRGIMGNLALITTSLCYFYILEEKGRYYK